MRPSTEAIPPERCAIWTVNPGWRSNTPELMSRIVAMISEKFAPNRTRRIEAVELLRIIKPQRRVHEHEHPQPRGFGPEWLECGIVEKKAVGLRRDDNP